MSPRRTWIVDEAGDSAALERRLNSLESEGTRIKHVVAVQGRPATFIVVSALGRGWLGPVLLALGIAAAFVLAVLLGRIVSEWFGRIPG